MKTTSTCRDSHITSPSPSPPSSHCSSPSPTHTLSRSQPQPTNTHIPVSAPRLRAESRLVSCAGTAALRAPRATFFLPPLRRAMLRPPTFALQSESLPFPCLLSIAPSSVPGPGPPASPTPSHLARRHLHRGCMPQGGTVTRSGPLASCLLCMPQRPSGGGAQLQPPPRRKLASRHTQQALSLALYPSRPLLLSLSNFLVSCLSVCLPRAHTRRMVHDAVAAIAGLEVSLPVGSLESTVRYSRRHAPTFQSASPVTGKWVGGCTLAQI